ncbi:MAG: aspartate aminotransferase family protein [Actinomycetota bacterium]
MATEIATDELKTRAKEIAERETANLLDRTGASAKLYQRAIKSLPLGVTSSFQANEPYPLYGDHGKGSKLWDVDGNEYVDYHNGFGTMVVGHAHPKVVAAIEKAARSGTHFATTTPTAIEMAEELCRRFGLERVRFSNSGTEATMDAIRVGRAVTGKDGLLKIEASYHGHHDVVMFSVIPSYDELGPTERPYNAPFSRGITKGTASEIHVVPFNDPAALEAKLAESGDEIGAMIMEPIMMNVGLIPPDPGYLEKVRELCTKHNVAMIFDEVKTGATVAPGGAIELFGVQPDLACFAKAIGGGAPIGAFGGKAVFMDEIGKSLAALGTFNGNPLSTSAGLAALTEVLVPEAYDHLSKLGTRLATGCEKVLSEYGIAGHVRDFGSKGAISYRAEPFRNYRDYLEADAEIFYGNYPWMLNRGIFMTPGDEEQWTISVQHSDEDIDRYVDAYAGYCEELTRGIS